MVKKVVKMVVSIIVPSLRPEMAQGCINPIHKSATGLDYELILFYR